MSAPDWRKSRRSSDNGGNCVEVATVEGQEAPELI
jgi:hypothetical protein